MVEGSGKVNGIIPYFCGTFALNFGRPETNNKRMCLGKYQGAGNTLPDICTQDVWSVPALCQGSYRSRG